MAILMIPDNQADFAGTPGYRFGDANSGKAAGKWYRVLSAGPSFTNPISGGLPGNLVSSPNRSTDLPGTNNIVAGEVQSRDGLGDSALINKLSCLDESYRKQSVINYDFDPEPGTSGYNSNSFVTGLLNAANVRYRLPGIYIPGASKPVPIENFNVFP